jgi:hypothetical protein
LKVAGLRTGTPRSGASSLIGRRAQLASAPGGPVRLREHADDAVREIQQRAQRGQAQNLRRTRERYA